MKKSALAGLSMMLILHLAGCGGGSGGGGDAPLAQKTATITFGVMSTATLGGVPINGINVTVQLPAGATVSGTGEISDAKILAGMNGATLLAPGNYVPSLNQVTFNVTSVPGIAWGDFARLTCNVTPGTTLTEGSFTAANTPLPAFKAVGYEAGNTVDLTGKTKPALKVTFGF
jgi:hypothetical protein